MERKRGEYSIGRERETRWEEGAEWMERKRGEYGKGEGR